ncbi:MAG: hypothetical protein E6H09_18350 [Bacteroidetes bacterium]|nr:MAG: hypothetical protein E6H09_18350 [Bacteroidota bacterium]
MKVGATKLYYLGGIAHASRGRGHLIGAISFIAYFFIAGRSFCQVRILLQIDNATEGINKNIYGHFDEHLGLASMDGSMLGIATG